MTSVAPAPAQPAERARLGYRPALDGLRALAIALVILHHTAALLLPAWQRRFVPGGFLGVDVFLVLSGFLITTLLLERREREARPLLTFYARRALRLLPAVLLLLTANLAYAIGYGNVGQAARSFVVVLTYLTNWAELAGVSFSPYLTHLWSLAVEEQFYLLWPPILFSLLALWRSPRRLAVLVAGLVVLAAGWRAALYGTGDPWLRIYIRTDARADALAIGALLALLPPGWTRGRLTPRSRAALGTAGLAVVVAAALLLQPDAAILYRGGFTVVALAVAMVILALLAGPSRVADVLSLRAMVWLGRLSYSLYLWHFGVFAIVAARAASWSPGLRILLAWAVTLAAAAFSYACVERPALGLKDRLGRG